MTQIHSLAKKEYWKKIPKEERSRRMREIALQKHAQLTPVNRSKLAKIMADTRWKNKLSTDEIEMKNKKK